MYACLYLRKANNDVLFNLNQEANTLIFHDPHDTNSKFYGLGVIKTPHTLRHGAKGIEPNVNSPAVFLGFT